MPKRSPDQDGPSWKFRRRVFSVSLLFSMSTIVSILVWRWDDTRLAETVVVSSFAVIAAVVGTYGATATWQDIKLWHSETDSYVQPRPEPNRQQQSPQPDTWSSQHPPDDTI